MGMDFCIITAIPMEIPHSTSTGSLSVITVHMAISLAELEATGARI